jgi:glutamyl-tRNA synthetase
MPSGWLEQLILAFRERVKTLVDMAEAAIPYLQADVRIDQAAAEKFLTPAVVPILEKFAAALEGLPDFSRHSVENVFQRLVAETGLKMGQLAQPVRVALTGSTASPGIHEVIALLGRDRTITRLHAAIQRSKSPRP